MTNADRRQQYTLVHTSTIQKQQNRRVCRAASEHILYTHIYRFHPIIVKTIHYFFLLAIFFILFNDIKNSHTNPNWICFVSRRGESKRVTLLCAILLSTMFISQRLDVSMNARTELVKLIRAKHTPTQTLAIACVPLWQLLHDNSHHLTIPVAVVAVVTESIVYKSLLRLKV